MIHRPDQAHGLCWTRSATQQGEAFEIKIPIDKGLVGEAATTGKTINIRDAYQDSRFNRNIDKQTGYFYYTYILLDCCSHTHRHTLSMRN